jgi:hypothetical protein
LNAKIRIDDLKKPLLSAANAWVGKTLHSIYFSPDKKFGFIIGVSASAKVGDPVELAQGPNKGLGTGVIVEITG